MGNLDSFPAPGASREQAGADHIRPLLLMAARGESFSAVKKARTYITAALEFAVDEQLISRNPGRKLELPSKRLRRPCARFYSLDEMRRLLSAAAAVSFREHLIVRLFVIGGLRAQEMFALRIDDVEPGILRIDEALKETEKGSARVGETKSTTSNGYIAISPELEAELRTWLQIRNMADPYHRTTAASNDLLFPTEAGTPYRIGNYLKRVLKPIAETAGIADVTYQGLRRTFATHFQRYGSPKDAQAQLRPLEARNDRLVHEANPRDGSSCSRKDGHRHLQRCATSR